MDRIHLNAKFGHLQLSEEHLADAEVHLKLVKGLRNYVTVSNELRKYSSIPIFLN
jgi:hypothetical protein